MNEVHIAAIVGGHGEVESVPILFRRIAVVLDPGLVVQMKQPLRVSESSLAKGGELERHVEFSARSAGRHGGIFILMDCDWPGGCPKNDAPAWLQRARRARPDMEISLVLANKDYEAWFLAAAESLRGHCGLPSDLAAPPDPEDIRGAKEWLRKHMPPIRKYRATVDQPVLTSVFDMQAARRADSFDKCYREIVRLLTVLRSVE
ncbi:MAG: hypothetical protein KBE65_16980 [Phycisphaerae bacterium]|nr:hypothetical protein [Phycisphaerae bacterium]